MLVCTLEVSFLSLIPSPSQLSAFMLFSPDELDTEKDILVKTHGLDYPIKAIIKTIAVGDE